MSDYFPGNFQLPTVDELFFSDTNVENDDILASVFSGEYEFEESDPDSIQLINQSLPSETVTESTQPNQRFISVTDEEIEHFEEAHQSSSTKSNTKWIMKLFQEWHVYEFGSPLDMMTVSASDLCDKLRRFYCGAKTKNGQPYHKNTLKNIRAGINRHLCDIGREIDVVRGIEFRTANRVLDGMLKDMVQRGMSKPTQHKPIIEHPDQLKISSYFESHAKTNPITLRQAVWYIMSVHFVSRGLEFHHQLQKSSLEFHADDNGTEYVKLSFEYQQKNFQGGLNSREAPSDKRMYATGQQNCPIKLLRLLLEKTEESATFIFNSCLKEALSSPSLCSKWYGDKHLSKRSFTNFMPDIAKSAGCTMKYTAHCLRATAITTMSQAGYETRQIMYMSGHQNESSLRSYDRNLSTDQKKRVSATLSSISDTANNNQLVLAAPMTRDTSRPLPPNAVSPQSASPSADTICVQPQHVTSGALSQSNSMTMANISSAQGFLQHGVFNGCVFHFNTK